MKDWPGLDEARHKKEQAAAELRKQQREQQEKAAAEAKARQQLKEERLGALTEKWDALIKGLLSRLAEATWSKQGKKWAIKTETKSAEDWRGSHFIWTSHFISWAVGWDYSASGSGHFYEESEYYRVTLVTDGDFSPTRFEIECSEKSLAQSRRIILANVSEGELKAALVEAYECGPVRHSHLVIDRSP